MYIHTCIYTYIHTYIHTYTQGEEPLVNPYADAELCVKLPNDLHHWVFERTRCVDLSINSFKYISIYLYVVYNMV